MTRSTISYGLWIRLVAIAAIAIAVVFTFQAVYNNVCEDNLSASALGIIGALVGGLGALLIGIRHNSTSAAGTGKNAKEVDDDTIQ